jgi:hypothetical protein
MDWKTVRSAGMKAPFQLMVDILVEFAAVSATKR